MNSKTSLLTICIEKKSHIFLKTCLLLALLVCIQPGLSSANTAQIKARCYSLSVGPASTNTGSTIYFTSYDGGSGVPLHDEKDGLWYVSSEMLPQTLGGSVYVTDYLVSNNQGIYEYGAASFSFPSTDSNNNGFPDFMEKERAASASFSGSADPHWNGYGVYLNSAFSGSMTRSSNNRTGTYSGSYSNDEGTANFSGSWEIFHADGTINYSEDTVNFTVSLTSSGGTENFSGTSTYTLNGSDQITVNAFNLVSTSGDSGTIRVYSATLNRYGKLYRGNVQLGDGGPATSWRDYYHWQFEIRDDNDWDGDGIPDLTDPPVTVVSISISGHSEVDEGTANIYTCTANYSDGTSSDVSSSVTWRITGDTVGSSFDGNSLIAGDVNSDTTITIQAQYTFRGATKTKTMDILIKDLRAGVLPALIMLLDDGD